MIVFGYWECICLGKVVRSVVVVVSAGGVAAETLGDPAHARHAAGMVNARIAKGRGVLNIYNLVPSELRPAGDSVLSRPCLLGYQWEYPIVSS